MAQTAAGDGREPIQGALPGAASPATTGHATDPDRVRLEAILAAMGDAVLVVATDGTVLLANQAAERRFGPLGKWLRIPHRDRGAVSEGSEAIARLSRGESFDVEFEAVAADGERRWYEATAHPFDGELGDAGVLIIRDVSERTLRSLQERFIAIAGHELRTPLTAVRGYLAVLRRRLALSPDDPRSDLLDEASGQLERLGALVDELLDASHVRSERVTLERKKTALVALVETAVGTASALDEAREFTVDAPEDDIVVLADARRLEQAVLNLLINAVRHAPGDSPIRVSIRRDAAIASVSVADDGPGIPVQRQAGLFEPFGYRDGTRDPGGLGLGLYIAHRIVEAHGGSIRVDSAEGRGSTFTIELPLPRRPRATR